jgi:DNA mismatch endonuclease (patch repair protein)
MAKISGKNTKPEIMVRKYLFSEGLRYLKNDKRLPGTPDIVLPKYKTVVFVHGCFWHHHQNCKKSKLPETRKKFWKEKIHKNTNRDRKNYTDLKELGWRVIVVWQCEISNREKREVKLPELVYLIKKTS